MAAARLNRLTDLLGQSLAGFVISLVFVALIDGIAVLLSGSRFGQTSGWLALVFPVIIFVQQFSAAQGERGRILVAVGGVVLALGTGLTAAAVFAFLPPMASGAIGALVTILVYITVWHVGLTLASRST